MNNKVKTLIKNKLYNWFNVSIIKGEYLTTDMALYRAKERGCNINSIIDVGASNGMWSKMCLEIYPEANYLLIEAQELHRKDLEIFKAKNRNVNFEISAAGDKVGEIYFNNDRAFGGQASETPYETGIKIKMDTIDNLVQKYNLKPPFLIKLDTHGFEVPILNGAYETLKTTNLAIIETYNFKIAENSLLFHEMNEFMLKRGFRVSEIVDLLLRKKDKVFWQMDTFYIPSSDSVFKHNKYE